MRTYKVGLNAGHGIYTPGKRCLKSIDSNETREWVLNNRIAIKIEEKLKDYDGIEVYRLDDKTGKRDVPLKERTDTANTLKLDFVDDIHHNAGINGGNGGGIMVIRHHITGQATKDYQEIMYDKLIKYTGLNGNRSNPKSTQNLHMCRETDMPTLTIEHGFMDSTVDTPIILTEEFSEQCANAHVEFYVEVFNLKRKQVANTIYRVRKEWLDAKSQKGAFGNLQYAINRALEVGNEYKVYDENGKQVYPSNVHWARKHYDSLIDKNINVTDTDFDKEITLGNAYKLFDELTDDVNLHDKKEDEVEKEPEKEIEVVETDTKKSKYYKIGDAHIIETTPDNIEISILANNLHSAKRFGINGTFYDTNTAPVRSPESCVFIAMNDGKALSNNAQFNGWNAPPRATMIYHTNGKIGFRQLKNINSIKDSTIWAIGGYMIKPYMDFKNEKIPGSVNYKTAHSYIGSKGDKIYLIVKPNHMISEIVPLANRLGLEKMLVVDGGGSSQLNHPDGQYKSTRVINSAVLLKEV